MKVEGVHSNPSSPKSVDFEIGYDTPTYGRLAAYFSAPTSLARFSELYFLEMDRHHFLGGDDKKLAGVVDGRNSEADVKNDFEFAFDSSQRLNAPELATAEELFDKGFIRPLNDWPGRLGELSLPVDRCGREESGGVRGRSHGYIGSSRRLFDRIRQTEPRITPGRRRFNPK